MSEQITCDACEGRGGYWTARHDSDVVTDPNDVEFIVCEECEGEGVVRISDDELEEHGQMSAFDG